MDNLPNDFMLWLLPYLPRRVVLLIRGLVIGALFAALVTVICAMIAVGFVLLVGICGWVRDELEAGRYTSILAAFLVTVFVAGFATGTYWQYIDDDKKLPRREKKSEDSE